MHNKTSLQWFQLFKCEQALKYDSSKTLLPISSWKPMEMEDDSNKVCVEIECGRKKETDKTQTTKCEGKEKQKEKKRDFEYKMEKVIHQPNREAAVLMQWIQKQHLWSFSGSFPVLGNNRVDLYGCSFPHVRPNFPLCQSTQSLSSSLFFLHHSSLLCENTNDLSATISPSSHQYLISCTGRNLAWIIPLEAICRYN